MTKALQDSDAFVRETAAKVLGGFGPKAKAAVPALTAIVQAKDAEAQGAAARALWKIDPQGAVGVEPVNYVAHLSVGPAEEAEPVWREYLKSLAAQSAKIAGRRFDFAAGELIHTENSYKYAIDEFRALAARAGFQPVHTWTDRYALFSVHYFRQG